MKRKIPGIKIIDWYIIRKFLGTYTFATALIIVIVVIFDAAENADDFMEMHAPFTDVALRYYLNFIPFFINQFSGLFTFIAVIFFTSKMAYNTEIVAILSSGVSFKRLMWPYFLSATVITVVTLVLNLYVIPVANAGRLAFEKQYIKRVQSAHSKFEPSIYRQVAPGTFVYIRDFSGETNVATYFSLETYEGGKILSSLEAANAEFHPETGTWTAPRSIQRHFDGDAETFKAEQQMDTLLNLTRDEMGKVQDLVQTMNIKELGVFIRQQRSKGSDMVINFEVERNNRYALPISTFILTAIGVSLSSRKVRGGTGLHIALGIALCFSFILFGRFFDEFAKGGALPPALAVWLPNIIYSFIAVYLYIKAPK